MTRTQGILAVLILGMFLTMLGFHLFVVKHSSEGRHSSTYLMNVEFSQAKRILTRKESLEEIVKSQHGRVVSRKWNKINLSSERLLKNWVVDAEGEFVVVTENPEIGQMTLHFRQQAVITKTSINSTTYLGYPCGNIKDIVTKTEMVPEGTQTRVKTDTYLRYERRLPKNWIPYMDSKVQEATEIMSEKSHQSISDLVERNKNKKFFIPLIK